MLGPTTYFCMSGSLLLLLTDECLVKYGLKFVDCYEHKWSEDLVENKLLYIFSTDAIIEIIVDNQDEFTKHYMRLLQRLDVSNPNLRSDFLQSRWAHSV